MSPAPKTQSASAAAPKAAPKPPVPTVTPCELCGAAGAERITVLAKFVVGLPFEPVSVNACPACTPAGLKKAADALVRQAADLKRRRAILELNNELRILLAQPGSPNRDAAVAANRAEKAALVELRRIETAGLRAALARLAR